VDTLGNIVKGKKEEDPTGAKEKQDIPIPPLPQCHP
jgi:hypothetical protein